MQNDSDCAVVRENNDNPVCKFAPLAFVSSTSAIFTQVLCFSLISCGLCDSIMAVKVIW